jgi:redox-sensitive bicupin YhaK (pirin superfamily)
LSLKIWLLPERKGIEPGYEQKAFADEEKPGRWRVVASREGRNGSLKIHQDTSVYLAMLGRGMSLSYPLAAGRHAWLQVLRSRVTLGDRPLGTSDGVAVSDEISLEVTASDDAELMLFDLA